MFTGIITAIGTVRKAEMRGDLRLEIATDADLADVALGASIACSGPCLTVVDKGQDWFAVDVSAETRECTAPGMWAEGARLNLERALRMGEELGGHIVTGHVDSVGQIVGIEESGDSLVMTVSVPKTIGSLLAPKGSVALDGASLTVNGVRDGDGTTEFTVNLIPHTRSATTFDVLEIGRQCNVEIDILARYLGRMMVAQSHLN